MSISTAYRISLLTLVSFALGACSIYRNKGREQFEERSSGRVRSEVGTSSLASLQNLNEDDFSNCWVQKTNEPLWSFPKDSRLEIYHTSDDKMAVCVRSPEIDIEDPDPAISYEVLR